MKVKWISAIIGFLFGGPFGAVLGYGAGSLIDSLFRKEYSYSGRTGGDIVISLLMLFSLAMKADGKVMKSELNYVREWLRRNLGEANIQTRIDILREFLNREDIREEDVCREIRRRVGSEDTLTQIVFMLFDICHADGDFTDAERQFIERICSMMFYSWSSADFITMETLWMRSRTNGYDYSYSQNSYGGGYYGQSNTEASERELKDAYAILQADENTTDEQLKKNYRKLCVKYHPDKVATLSKEVQAQATQRFQQIQSAYELIKKKRNIN